MIQRVVLVKLKPEYATDEARAKIASETLEVLPEAHGVIDVQVGIAADSRTAREWDLSILVKLATIEDVEIYRTDKVHRAYADVFLAPLRDKIHVFNYQLSEQGDPQG